MHWRKNKKSYLDSFSKFNRSCFNDSPPEYPPRDPLAEITRWHGIIIAKALAPLALPTALTAFLLPTLAANVS